MNGEGMKYCSVDGRKECEVGDMDERLKDPGFKYLGDT